MVSQHPSALRQSWKQHPHDSYASLRKFLRRSWFLLLLVGLLGALGYLLLSPFWHPNFQWLEIKETRYSPASGAPLADMGRPAKEDVDSPLQLGPPANGYRLEEIRSPQAVSQFLQDPQLISLDQSDVLVCYVQARGMMIDGRPALVCREFSVNQTEEAVFFLEDLIVRLNRLTSGTKLLVLETDDQNYDARTGQVPGCFIGQVHALVAKSKQQNLWLLTSHVDGQFSQTSTTLGGSLFRYWFGLGLRGYADIDANQVVDLRELSKFVTDHVQAVSWRRSQSTERQTPRLSWGGGRVLPSKFPRLVAATVPASQSMDHQLRKLVNSTGQSDDNSDALGDGFVTANRSETDPQNPTDAQGADAQVESDGGKPILAPASDQPASEPVSQPKSNLTTPQLITESLSFTERLRESPYPSPIDLAPSLYQAIEHDLFWYEQAWHLQHDADDRELIQKEIKRIHFGLNQSISNKSVAKTFDPKIGLLSQLCQGLRATGSEIEVDINPIVDPSPRNWVAKHPPDESTRSPVLALLYELVDHSSVGDELIKTAVTAFHQSERLTRYADLMGDRLRNRFAKAERERLLAQRQLLDRTHPNWRDFVTEAYQKTTTRYEKLDADVQLLLTCRRLRDRLLNRLPAYLSLRSKLSLAAQASFLSVQQIERLSELLLGLTDGLVDQDVDACASLLREINPLQRRVFGDADALASTQIASTTANLFVLRQLALSPATTFEFRSQIRRELPRRDAAFWEDFQTPIEPVTGGANPSNTPDQSFLYTRLASVEQRLLAARFPAHRDLRKRQSQTAAASQADACKLYGDLASTFGQHLDAIAQTIKTGSPASYLQWSSLMQLVDPRDIDFIDVQMLLDQRKSALTARRLQLQLSRLSQAISDATDAERRDLVQQMDLAREELTAVLPDQGNSAGRGDREKVLSVSSASSLNLITAPEAKVAVNLNSLADQPTAVWLVLDYDRNILEVTADDAAEFSTVYARWPLRESLSRAFSEARVTAGWEGSRRDHDQENTGPSRVTASDLAEALAYPVDPSKAGLPPTFQLEPGSPVSLALNVRRRVVSGVPAKLIVKAISQAGDTRHEIDVQLPSSPAVRLNVDGPSELFSESPSGIVLHPLPNRATSFDVAVTNPASSPRTIDLRLWNPENQESANLPVGGVPRSQVNRVMKSLGAATVIAERRNVQLASGARSPLGGLLLKRVGSASAADVTETQDKQKSDFITYATRRYVVLQVTDVDSGESIFRSIEIAVQRPRRYLRPTLQFNAATRQLRIQIAPLAPQIIPDEGIQVTATVKASAANTPAVLTGSITGTDDLAVLSSVIPTGSDQVRVTIDVDGYQRAFVYQFPCFESFASMERESEAFGVRIVTPDGRPLSIGSQVSLPVQLEVDAPPGSFPLMRPHRDLVEIGLDLDRDREFRGERVIRLQSDRRVKFTTTIDQSLYRVESQVDDFSPQIPARFTGDGRVNLLARLTVGQRRTWSDSVDVVVDRSGPVIQKVELRPDRWVLPNQSITARVFATDAGLSGVAGVDFLIDTASVGLFAEDAKPIVAKQDTLSGWVAEIPLKDILPGKIDLLARATDRLGNVGPTRATKVIVRDRGADVPPRDTNSVSGAVTYDGRPLANAKVTLTPLQDDSNASGEKGSDADADADQAPPRRTRTSSTGRFRLTDVRFGDYRVRVVGLARNKPRVAEENVSVKPKPARGIRLTLAAD